MEIDGAHAFSGQWRRGMGVEPTQRRMAPPTGFEARPTHQGRFPSVENLSALQRGASCRFLDEQRAVAAQPVHIADAAQQADAVEVLQELDRPFAPQLRGIAKTCRHDLAAMDVRHLPCKPASVAIVAGG